MLFLGLMSLGFVLGFLRWLKHLFLYIGALNTFVDTLDGHYMKIGFSIREDSLGYCNRTLI